MSDLLNNEVKLINFLDLPYDVQLQTRNWRNSEEISKWFKIPYIKKEIHQKWLESLKIFNPTNIAFCIKYNNSLIGVTYFHSINYDDKSADWGIYIKDLCYRGKHLGSSVLKESLKYAKNVLKLNKIYLDVKSTNYIAISVYEKNGFKRIQNLSDDIFYRYCCNI